MTTLDRWSEPSTWSSRKVIAPIECSTLRAALTRRFRESRSVSDK